MAKNKKVFCNIFVNKNANVNNFERFSLLLFLKKFVPFDFKPLEVACVCEWEFFFNDNQIQ